MGWEALRRWKKGRRGAGFTGEGILPLGLGSALQTLSARCCGRRVELGLSMEVKNNYYILAPKGLLFTSQELKISGYFLISKDGASLLAEQGLVIPNLATGSGPIKGCGAPVATEGSGGSNWAAGSVLLFAQLGSAWSCGSSLAQREPISSTGAELLPGLQQP